MQQPALWIRIIMAALRNTAGHYILDLWFLLTSFFFFFFFLT